MNKNINLPLTETIYYILLALATPNHGYAIMQQVEELSEGNVRLAAGTLYGALENLLEKKFIASVQGSDARRKVYVISQRGKQVLLEDYQRIKALVDVTSTVFDFEREVNKNV